MAIKDPDTLWKTILGEIETEISKPNFLTLFRHTMLLSISDKTATIAAPSAMIIDMLQKRFMPLLKQKLAKHTGNEASLIFIAKTPKKGVGEERNGPLFINEVLRQPVTNILSQPRFLSRVRPEFTFENLAVSTSNQLAVVSAQTVVKNLGHSYNPLFIYGPTGVGKTHLMQAIANEVFYKNQERKIIYLTSEEFTNDVVEAIRSNDTARMKKRFRTADLLIIDDVQFIAGKDRVQEELFHTFNILIDNASQVVLSSDRPPNEIKKLEKRLSSRFTAGLTVDIELPDFELRSAILLIKAKKYGVELPIDAAKLIAQTTTDARSLEGMFLRIITESKARGEDITNELVNRVLKGKGAKDPLGHLHPDDVVACVCSFYDIKSTQLKGPKRDASLVRARQITMYLLKKELQMTYLEIGNTLGGRDHTTIMYGVGKIESQLSTSEAKNMGVSADILRISRILSGQRGD
ncbi:MAG: chromosomal replication initiator protein DnaA [Candidatus Levybacteria bacterium]|nr:chromosomal replication initiator protein DnaA [Candidatus Levybacteria bacterium]